MPDRGDRIQWAAVVFGVVLVIASAVVLVDEIAGGGDDSAEIAAAPAFTPEELAALPEDGWLTNGGSLANQRYSPLDEINTENVDELKGEWMTDLEESAVAAKYSAEAQPIVHDGTIYVVTGADDVFAVDVESGDIRWRYEAKLNRKITSVCCGWTSRGVAIGDGRVYVGQLDGKLVALDQTTGEREWVAKIGDWRNGYTVTSAPLYYDGRVYSGVSGGEFQVRGRLTAVDAETGKVDWRFFTVPGPGERGHRTWPSNTNNWKRGGAPIWQTPAVDPELGMLYFSTGNASPDDEGQARKGDNLFTASIVALDAKTGKYRWHFQQVHHDIWDYDSPNPVILMDLEVDGRERRGLAQASKTGWVYVLDRESGKPIHPVKERPVPQNAFQKTAATQPYPTTEPIIPHTVSDEQFATIRKLGQRTKDTRGLRPVHGELFSPVVPGEMNVVAPGPQGGVNWPPSSYNPDTGLMYVCAQATAGGYSVGVTERPDDPGASPYLGSIWTITGFTDNPGRLAAFNPSTGKIEWMKRWKDSCYSGSTTTAGGLVFVGRNNGELQAYDAETGDRRWSFQTGAGANNTATVFEHDGKQYVAFYAGGNSLAATSHGDNLWLFSLDGDMGPAEAGGAGGGVQHAGEGEQESTAREGDAGAGEQVFGENCSSCHGVSGGGGNGGPPLTTSDLDEDGIIEQIEKGGGGMPAFESQLTPQQIADVAAFVRTLQKSK